MRDMKEFIESYRRRKEQQGANKYNTLFWPDLLQVHVLAVEGVDVEDHVVREWNCISYGMEAGFECGYRAAKARYKKGASNTNATTQTV